MPIYEYRCTRCGAVSEVLQRVSEPPKRKCLDCSGRLEKLVSRTSFQLKGGGWFDQGNPPPDDMTPQRLYVDFVRVYEQHSVTSR